MQFKSRVLDNVHGFIYYTEVEEEVMNTTLFKRLQSIKQLSIVNWEFPGAEHTRYIHSLGVMHIADKIAIQLKLTEKERRIIRMAALLHDIGHYPLSHVGEGPYREGWEYLTNDKSKVNNSVLDKIEHYSNPVNKTNNISGTGYRVPKEMYFMSKSTGLHHEKCAEFLISGNPQESEIAQIIIKNFGKDALKIISDMIIGNVDDGTEPLFVQILHSELDADGIDYMMRDALFSGTSFGTFEVDQLIGCMEVKKYEGYRILCINPKGIAAADQYLINKFLSYAQVTFNKHVVITEWMVEQVMIWMQENKVYFKSRKKFRAAFYSKDHYKETMTWYTRFTDDLFWMAVQNIADDKTEKKPDLIVRYFCQRLLEHKELPYIENSEVKIISNDAKSMEAKLKKAKVYKDLKANKKNKRPDFVVLCQERKMSRQIPEKEYNKYLKNHKAQIATIGVTPSLSARRFMECITVKDGNKRLHLLCDDPRSLMQTLYNTRMVILREYECKESY